MKNMNAAMHPVNDLKFDLMVILEDYNLQKA